MSHKYVYLFSEGDENMRELLGGKGANMTIVLRNQLVQHVCILPLRCSPCPLVLKMLLLIILSVIRRFRCSTV